MLTVFFIIGTKGEFQVRLVKSGEVVAVHKTPQLQEVVSYELEVDDTGQFHFIDAYYTENKHRRSISAESKIELDFQGVDIDLVVEITLGDSGSKQSKVFLNGELQQVQGELLDLPICSFELKVQPDGTFKLESGRVNMKGDGKLLDLADYLENALRLNEF